jgi:alkylated DNA repair dioxygenase AlkB
MNQLNVFEGLKSPKSIVEVDSSLNDFVKIDGLIYKSNYISNLEHFLLWNSIYSEVWLDDLKRRVQHYGYKYDYKSKFIDYSMKVGDLPNWSLATAYQLLNDGYMHSIPDQLIVNEYHPGQGITNHVDCEPCFGDTIASISLGSGCVMDLINIKTKEKIAIYLEPNSLLVLKGVARYEWSHGIHAKKTDVFKDERYDRHLRVSLTFRNVIHV